MKPEQKERIKALGLVFAVLIVIVLIISFFVPRGEDRCEKILLSEFKDDCYYTLAQDAGNSSFCDRIAKQFTHDVCISDVAAQQSGGAIDCDRLSSPSLKDQCIRSMASTTKNASYCAGLTGSLERDMCYDSIARGSEDPQACAGISTDYMEMSCNNDIYASLAAETRNPSLCNKLVYNESLARMGLIDNCIFNVAKQNNDTSLCSGIHSSVLLQQCVTGTVDFTLCDSISDTDQRSSCIFSLAISTDDPNSCDRIPTPYLKDNCYYQMAAKTGDSSICSRISGENLRSVCGRGG